MCYPKCGRSGDISGAGTVNALPGLPQQQRSLPRESAHTTLGKWWGNGQFEGSAARGISQPFRAEDDRWCQSNRARGISETLSSRPKRPVTYLYWLERWETRDSNPYEVPLHALTGRWSASFRQYPIAPAR